MGDARMKEFAHWMARGVIFMFGVVIVVQGSIYVYETFPRMWGFGAGVGTTLLTLSYLSFRSKT